MNVRNAEPSRGSVQEHYVQNWKGLENYNIRWQEVMRNGLSVGTENRMEGSVVSVADGEEEGESQARL